MTTMAGRPEWRALNERKEVVELPLAIDLHKFSIKEYPPKLIADRQQNRRISSSRKVSQRF